ncbi:unnamed protein product [Linum tenue]|uniref:Uncharacterized protein n=1 Tax=Linum tenue TaxID=586396 RepID=A0AAV0RW41_9ROSI|nr:unnamed protein product [Linum tenue]
MQSDSRASSTTNKRL